MGIFARMLRLFKRDASDDEAWSNGWWGSRSATGIEINQQSALMVPTVMACVSIISEDVANLEPHVFRRLDNGSKQIATDHWLSALLVRPNDWQPWGECCQQMLIGLLLRGNGYAVIIRDGRGRPIMLVPVNPDYVALWEAPDGSLFWRVTRSGLHMLAVLRDQPLMVPYENMLHLKGMSANGLLGLSKIAINREAIALALGQEQIAARTIGDGAKPSGVLTTAGKLTKEAADRIRDDWKTFNSGIANSGRTIVLEQGLEWKPLSLSMVDLEFIASRTFQIADIARIWRVPLHMLDADVGKSASSEITQKAQEYLNFTLRTYIRIIQQRLAFTFDLGPDVFVELDVSELIKADIVARYQSYRLALQGWMSVNEVRVLEGQPPISSPGGNMVFRPVNMAPLDSDVFMGADVDPNNTGPGSDMGGENMGAGRPSSTKINPDQDPGPK